MTISEIERLLRLADNRANGGWCAVTSEDAKLINDLVTVIRQFTPEPTKQPKLTGYEHYEYWHLDD